MRTYNDTKIDKKQITFADYTLKVVDEVPGGYKIWNIGPYTLKGYIPLCRIKSRRRMDGLMEIEVGTLLAVKTEGAYIIMNAIGGGCHTVALMEKFLLDNPDPVKGSWEAKKVYWLKRALPYMKQIKGL